MYVACNEMDQSNLRHLSFSFNTYKMYSFSMHIHYPKHLLKHLLHLVRGTKVKVSPIRLWNHAFDDRFARTISVLHEGFPTVFCKTGITWNIIDSPHLFYTRQLNNLYRGLFVCVLMWKQFSKHDCSHLIKLSWNM